MSFFVCSSLFLFPAHIFPLIVIAIKLNSQQYGESKYSESFLLILAYVSKYASNREKITLDLWAAISWWQM